MDDLAIIVVSTNEAHWLRPCLTSIFEHVGDIDLDVVLVDNESTDGTRDLVEAEFPDVRIVTSENHGFSHANNRGWLTTDARYALFLNPDTKILDGTFEQLVALMDERPRVGLVGVRQVTPSGALWPTIRRFPSALRTLGEALGSERWPVRPSWAGQRDLDMRHYEHETQVDWTSGSFMLARREALLSAGLLDERSFIYTEEPDLCLRMRKAGWTIAHVPYMTIVHHAGKGGIKPRMEAQNAWAMLHYAQKHFSLPHRAAFAAALGLGYVIRAARPGRGERVRDRRIASRRALSTMLGLAPPPFGDPPETALRPAHERSLRRDPAPLRGGTDRDTHPH